MAHCRTLVFGDKDHFLNDTRKAFCREQIIDFLNEKGIALFDTASSIRRLQDNASDKFLEVVQPTDIAALLRQLPECRAIVTTGQKATDTLRAQLEVEEPKVEEMDVVFLMDRFGYARTIDVTAYERNKEAANAENKYVFNCMNTDKICIFTDNGKMHSIKVADIPLVRFRDKGTPADNLSNYDSAQERMLYVAPLASVKENTLLFVTAASMCKLVSGAEFDVAKRTIVSYETC